MKLSSLCHDNSFTPLSRSDWPVMGIEVDWGSIKSTSEPAVWAIGLWRSPSIQYRTSQGSIVPRYPYYQSVYGDGIAAVSRSDHKPVSSSGLRNL